MNKRNYRFCAFRPALGILLALLWLIPMPLRAQDSLSVEKEDLDEDFVIASLVIADPGKNLYDCAGHAALHMQCPTHNLDYIFSYGTQDYGTVVLSYLAGDLKTGLAALSPEEFLIPFREEQRGVYEYTMNLPIGVKQNLWRVLDDHMMEGLNDPFDLIQRGCSSQTLNFIKEALDTIQIQYAPWPEKYDCSRKEVLSFRMKNNQWWGAVWDLMANGKIYEACSKEMKLTMPQDLLETLQAATVQGRPLVSSTPRQLLPSIYVNKPATWFSPWIAAFLVLFLTLLCLLFGKPYMDYFLLAFQTFIGILTVYLVFFTNLSGTEWSWFIVPFNPLPLLLWKWRRYWVLPYALIISVWAIYMLAAPQRMVGRYYVIVAISLVLDYINIYRRTRS